MSKNVAWSYNRSKTFFIRTVTFNLDSTLSSFKYMKPNYAQADVKKLLTELNRKAYS
jgi:hypothetical protein